MFVKVSPELCFKWLIQHWTDANYTFCKTGFVVINQMLQHVQGPIANIHCNRQIELDLVHQFFRFVPNLLYQVFDWGCQIRSCTTYSYQEKAIFGSYIGRLRWSYCIRSLIGSQIGFIRSWSNVLLSRRGCVWFRHSWQIVFWWHTLASSVGSAWCYYFLVFLCGATDWFYCLVLLFGAGGRLFFGDVLWCRLRLVPGLDWWPPSLLVVVQCGAGLPRVYF